MSADTDKLIGLARAGYYIPKSEWLPMLEAAARERDEALGVRAGEISAVQKVLEERRRAEDAEERYEMVSEQLDAQTATAFKFLERAEAAEAQRDDAYLDAKEWMDRCEAAEAQRDTLAKAAEPLLRLAETDGHIFISIRLLASQWEAFRDALEPPEDPQP